MAGRDIVVIGGSAGCIEALAELVGGLPPDFPGSVFIVVHFPGSVRRTLPHILSRAGPLPADHARDGEPIEPGRIYVAPPDSHLHVSDGHVHLTRGPKENGHRPAVDPLFRTAALSYGLRVVGVILSGNLNDGSAGLLRIKQRGGVAIVQDPDSALYPRMPRSALEHVAVDHMLIVPEISALVVDLARVPVESVEVSGALWTALRALEEHSAVSRRLAARAQARGHSQQRFLFHRTGHGCGAPRVSHSNGSKSRHSHG